MIEMYCFSPDTSMLTYSILMFRLTGFWWTAHLCHECFYLHLHARTCPPLGLYLNLQFGLLLLQGLQLRLHAQDVLLQVGFLRANPLQLALLLKKFLVPSTYRTKENIDSISTYNNIVQTLKSPYSFINHAFSCCLPLAISSPSSISITSASWHLDVCSCRVNVSLSSDS